MNSGISMVKGRYFFMLDSDDELQDGALKVMTENLNGEDFVLGGFVEYKGVVADRCVVPKSTRAYAADEMTSFLDTEIRHDCVLLDAPWAKLFRRKAIGNLRFSESLSYAEDKLFVFSFLSRCTSVRTVALPVYSYKLRIGSLGSDIRSDRHLKQLKIFLPAYASLLEELAAAHPGSVKVRDLYKKDLIGRYICRILNIFAVRKTPMLTEEFIAELYGMIAKRPSVGVFSIRPGQVFNMILYRIGNPRFSVVMYRILTCCRK
jgi:glycosyltransferase involved in cell wall biosynthesis